MYKGHLRVAFVYSLGGRLTLKYMTFRASCAFAGVANMLESFGIDVTDRDIALGMKLPFLFAKEEGTYLGGPILMSLSD